jgi:hypothetical protein
LGDYDDLRREGNGAFIKAWGLLAKVYDHIKEEEIRSDSVLKEKNAE